MEEKERSQIADEYKWDLSTIYKDISLLQQDYEETKNKIEEFSEREETFLIDAKKLYETLCAHDAISVILDKMWTYVHEKYDEDLSNNKNQEWKDKVYNLYETFSEKTSFMIPKLMTFGSKNINKFYEEMPKLKEDYGVNLEEIFRFENHTLTSQEEKLISQLGKSMSNTSKIANMLTCSDIDFGEIEDENGKKVKLTDTNYVFYMTSKNRNVRKEAFYTLYKSYKQFNNTLALSLAAQIEKKVNISKIRKFNSSLEAALFEDNVNVNVYNNLIETVSKNLDSLYDYYEVKRNVLELDEFHLYDVYAEINANNKNKYTYDETKQNVIEALKVLGEDYVTILKKAFDERWIDVYPNKGKKGGAYSSGSYLTNPFVLLNYTETYHDMLTVAHELGHSIHTYYSNKNNPYQYSDYKIFVAEVASQVNELLVNDYMLKKVKTKEEKIDILNQTLDIFKSSIYRQTMFAEFEKQIAEEVEKDEVLTAEKLNNIYYNLVKKYFGDRVVVDEEIKYEWERIPHFYYNFYVYKYSTGLAAAAHIVTRIINKENGALESYLAFLKTGGSMQPLDELKIAGVDLTNPEVIQSAMNMFKTYLENLKTEINN